MAFYLYRYGEVRIGRTFRLMPRTQVDRLDFSRRSRRVRWRATLGGRESRL